jgi:antitoxin HicB
VQNSSGGSGSSGRERGVLVRFEARHGKGSHDRLHYGERFTTVKDRKKGDPPGIAARHVEPAWFDNSGYQVGGSVVRYEYPVHLERQADGSVLVTFPDVPEAVTDGTDPDEALREAQDALIAALGGYINARRPIPGPSSMKGPRIHLPSLIAAKLALYQAMWEAGLTAVALAKRLGLSEGAVRRLLDLDHRSHIGQLEAALAALGKRLSVEVYDAA